MLPFEVAAVNRKRHVVIPDTQIRPGVPTKHLDWIARYILDMSQEPDHIQFLGDWYDMPSLSSWSKKGSLESEGNRIQADRDSGYRALEGLFEAFAQAGFSPKSTWVCEGNHEYRLDRTISDDPRLEGLINRRTFYGWQDFGIKSAPMGKPMHKDGVTYCHFFDLGPNGNTTGSRTGQPSAHAQVRRVRGSTVAGHKQGYDSASLTHPYCKRPRQQTFAVIAGSCYLHKEAYRGPSDGYESRGIVILNELNGQGRGVPMFVSLEYLESNYGT